LWRKDDRFSGKRRLELFGVLDQLKLLTCRHRLGQGQAQRGRGGQKKRFTEHVRFSRFIERPDWAMSANQNVLMH
jgi:hypothetical protein